jgi:hypothetical protein
MMRSLAGAKYAAPTRPDRMNSERPSHNPRLGELDGVAIEDHPDPGRQHEGRGDPDHRTHDARRLREAGSILGVAGALDTSADEPEHDAAADPHRDGDDVHEEQHLVERHRSLLLDQAPRS